MLIIQHLGLIHEKEFEASLGYRVIRASLDYLLSYWPQKKNKN